MALKIHPDIAALRPYVPGKPIEDLQRELGLAEVIKLASNENPLGPSTKAVAALAEAGSTLHRYPDGAAHALRTRLAERYKLALEQIVLGNGSDEILGMLCRAFLAPGQEAVLLDHTFVIYRMEVLTAHGVPRIIPAKQWRHDLAAMADAVCPKTRLVFVCNPNNPTGTIVGTHEVEALLERLPEHVIPVFDEAYYEYVTDPDFPDSIRYVRENRAVIVLRTFSKAYGLAGLRIGYGLTSTEIAGYLNRVRPPFNTNSLAQRAALAALEDDKHVARSRALNSEQMAVLRAGLSELGIDPIPSQANFLFFDCGQDGQAVFEALLHEGIIVRWIDGPMLRVTIGLPDENRRFLDALRTVLEREGAKRRS